MENESKHFTNIAIQLNDYQQLGIFFYNCFIVLVEFHVTSVSSVAFLLKLLSQLFQTFIHLHYMRKLGESNEIPFSV